MGGKSRVTPFGCYRHPKADKQRDCLERDTFIAFKPLEHVRDAFAPLAIAAHPPIAIVWRKEAGNRSFSNQRLGLAAMLWERRSVNRSCAQQGLEPAPTFVDRAGPMAEPFLHDNLE